MLEGSYNAHTLNLFSSGVTKWHRNSSLRSAPAPGQPSSANQAAVVRPYPLQTSRHLCLTREDTLRGAVWWSPPLDHHLLSLLPLPWWVAKISPLESATCILHRFNGSRVHDEDRRAVS